MLPIELLFDNNKYGVGWKMKTYVLVLQNMNPRYVPAYCEVLGASTKFDMLCHKADELATETFDPYVSYFVKAFDNESGLSLFKCELDYVGVKLI